MQKLGYANLHAVYPTNEDKIAIKIYRGRLKPSFRMFSSPFIIKNGKTIRF